MIGVCFPVFDCSIRQHSEFLKAVSLLAQVLLDFFPHLSIVWVNAFA